MARGAKKGGRGGSQRGANQSQPSGIEKYGQDEADEFLDLDAGDNDASEAESSLCDEEEVMAIDEEADEDDGLDYAPPKRSAKGTATQDKDSDEEPNLEAGSKGWRKNEFYGGEDDGDGSGSDSDEDLVFQEAKRLEELRAQQLGGEEDDVLAALLAAPAGSEEAEPAVSKASGLAAVASGAHFESVFAGETEKISSSRNIADLSASEKRKILKKEAPELMPLLNDFKIKLAALQELLPMLRPAVLKQLPATGASYLEAKASLLLNTLANLSFYMLLRAEGGAVKAHPVVPQLVWLRELHEQLAPLDGKLGKKMRKALAAARQVPDTAEQSGTAEEPTNRPAAGIQPSNGHRGAAAPPAPKKKTLQQRLERLQLAMPAQKATAEQARVAKVAKQPKLLTKDLLRLPKAKKEHSGNASAPADLDDIDPTLGIWAPKSSIGEQLSQVQQQTRERAARAEVLKGSADQNPEAKPRVARKERGEKHKEESDEAPEDGAPDAASGESGGDDEPDLIKSARRIAALNKEKRTVYETGRAAAKEEARRLRQYHPEDEEEGKRKANKRILNNRGLQRIRKKKAGNARVMNKEKYDKALKRRKGAVQDMRQGAEDGAGYDGEATGIRTHVRKSQRIS